MKAQILTFSKTSVIIKCCLIAFCIACIISALSTVNLHEFMQNIMDWESI